MRHSETQLKNADIDTPTSVSESDRIRKCVIRKRSSKMQTLTLQPLFPNPIGFGNASFGNADQQMQTHANFKFKLKFPNQVHDTWH